MVRFTILAVVALAFASGLSARDGSDPVFARIPFEQWLKQKQQAPIHWTLRISEPALSAHQRLGVVLDARVEGAEIARRRGEGKMLVLAQLTDGKNRTWQHHVEIDLERIEEGIKHKDVVFSQSFFVLPGDYRAAVAILDTATGEHNVIRRTLHVAPLKNDPLPEMWSDLPAVEFFPPQPVPDRWFLPSVEGRLRLRAESRHPAEVSLLVNLTPAERFATSSRTQNRNLGMLVPATKVLSEVDWHDAKFNIELLDLSRRRVAFHQEDMQLFHWAGARGALTETNAGTIDVKALANRRLSADFFLDQVARKIRAPAAPGKSSRVVIIFSASVFFEPGVEMRPIAMSVPPDVTIFYLRFQQPPPPVRFPDNPDSPDSLPPPRRLVPDDQLEPLLRPLAPRLFDVTTPREFRRSLAAILAQIAKL